MIDGQQRLTTLLVLLAALRDVRAKFDSEFSPKQYDDQYLTNPYNQSNTFRLVPTEFDRVAYERTVHENDSTGGIGQAYAWFKDKLTTAAESDRLDLARLSEIILLRLILVEINTSPADSINSIFNTLNSKGLPLTAADLVRNEFLLNLTNEQANEAYDAHWLPLEYALVKAKPTGELDDSALINYFLARELQSSPSVAAKDLFNSFERRFRRAISGKVQAERQQIVLAELKQLHERHDVYLAILDPSHDGGAAADLAPSVRAALQDLATWGSAPHVPLSFAVVVRYLEGVTDEADTEAALRLLLSFLVRRALAGVATNNLNRLLSPLPSQLNGSEGPSAEILAASLSRSGYR